MEWREIRSLDEVRAFQEWFEAQNTRTKNKIRVEMQEMLQLDLFDRQKNHLKARQVADNPLLRRKKRRRVSRRAS